MTKVAYKTMQNNPNIPNGFIYDHFETDQDTVEGYTVVSKEVFSQLLAKNIESMRMHEANVKNIEGAHPNAPPRPQRQNHEAEPATVSWITERNKAVQQTQEMIKQNQENIELFKQFMAWKASQGSGS